MNDDNDRDITLGKADATNLTTLTQTDLEIGRHTGVSGLEIVEHRRLKARGAFKPGVERPLKYILLGD